MKKIVALLLCIAMLCGTCAVAVYADEGNPDDMEIVSYIDDENPLPDPVVDPPVTPQPSGNGKVAKMRLCSNWTGLPSLGHIWIYFENISDHTLQVGAYTLPVGEGVSVGSFALTRSDGAGIYYNIESYTGNVIGMNDSLYIEKEINESQLKAVSNYILIANFWDPIIFNCLFFASMAWNIGGGGFVFPICIFPFITRLQLRLHGAKSGLSMYCPDRNRVYKQRSFGSAAHLERVSDGSVDTAPG